MSAGSSVFAIISKLTLSLTAGLDVMFLASAIVHAALLGKGGDEQKPIYRRRLFNSGKLFLILLTLSGVVYFAATKFLNVDASYLSFLK